MKASWVFDVISPFAFLELKQLPTLPSSVELEYVPILFAGLLKHYGQLGNAEIPPKRRFTYRFALWRGRQMGIPMRLPPAHPFNPLAALRLIVAAGSTRGAIDHVFDAAWLRGVDLADPDVIAQLAHELGVPDNTLNDAAVKQRLRANTEWAIQKGVFGVPTLLIDDEPFWGHDAFDMALQYVRDPRQLEDAEMRRADTIPVGIARTF